MSAITESERVIADLLTARTGQELSGSRAWRISTALSGLFRERGISNIDQLVCLLDSPDKAVLSQQVVEALLNNETYFFRDRAMFDQLAGTVLPRIAERKADTRRLSILCAGCSTGQEALSLAMIFLSQRAAWKDWAIEITGIDISQSAINAARAAVYSQFEIQRGLSVAQMLEHFTETPTGWEASDELRAMTQFRVHNLLQPLSGGPYDLILCRNVLLYFDNIARRSILTRLVQRLDRNGWLMLGAGETVTSDQAPLKAVRGAINLYRQSETDLAVETV